MKAFIKKGFGTLWILSIMYGVSLSQTKTTPPGPPKPIVPLIWQKCFGGSTYDNGMALIALDDGCFYLGGETNSGDGLGKGNPMPGKYDFLLIKVSSTGHIIWSTRTGGSCDEKFSAMKQTPDGGVIMIGTTDSNDGLIRGNNGKMDLFVTKFDQLGKVEWYHCYGGMGNDRGTAIEVLSDGTYMIGGESGSKTGDMTLSKGGLDSWIAKIDSRGKILRQQSMGGSGNEYVTHIIEIVKDRYVVVNQSNSRDFDIKAPMGETDAWLFCLSKNFDVVWNRSFGGSGFDEVHGVIKARDGSMAITGTSFSLDGDMDLTHNHGMADTWAFMVSAEGNLAWSELYGGVKSDGGNGIAQTPDGGFIIVGTSNSKDKLATDIPVRLYDGWIIRTDSIGKEIWSGTLGGENFEYLYGIYPLPEGNYMALGFAESQKGTLAPLGKDLGNDFWFFKFADPKSPADIPYKVAPCYLTGRITDAVTGLPISSEIIITDNTTFQTVARFNNNGANGIYHFPMDKVGKYSINITAGGHMFFGRDIVFDSITVNPEVRIDAQLEPIRVGSKIALRHIYFDPGEWTMKGESKPELNRLLYFLNTNPKVKIEISGHTDDTGDQTEKIELSKKRSDKIRDFLLLAGIVGSRMESKGYGMDKPIADNSTPEGRALNRRVEITITGVE